MYKLLLKKELQLLIGKKINQLRVVRNYEFRTNSKRAPNAEIEMRIVTKMKNV